MFEMLVAPIITGTAAGLAVAFGIAVTRWLAKPKLELQKFGNEGYAFLINRTCRSILLGNSHCMETQSMLLDTSNWGIQDQEKPISRLVVNRFGSRIVLLNGADLGDYVTFTYRPLWRISGGENYSKLGDEADTIGPFIFKDQPGDKSLRKWKEKSVLVTI